MITAILPKTNGSQVRVEVRVDDVYTASFWTHHFEVSMDNAVHQFQIWLLDQLGVTQGWIWADAILPAKE